MKSGDKKVNYIGPLPTRGPLLFSVSFIIITALIFIWTVEFWSSKTISFNFEHFVLLGIIILFVIEYLVAKRYISFILDVMSEMQDRNIEYFMIWQLHRIAKDISEEMRELKLKEFNKSKTVEFLCHETELQYILQQAKYAGADIYQLKSVANNLAYAKELLNYLQERNRLIDAASQLHIMHVVINDICEGNLSTARQKVNYAKYLLLRARLLKIEAEINLLFICNNFEEIESYIKSIEDEKEFKQVCDQFERIISNLDKENQDIHIQRLTYLRGTKHGSLGYIAAKHRLEHGLKSCT